MGGDKWNVFQQLDVSSRTEAVTLALCRGLIGLEA